MERATSNFVALFHRQFNDGIVAPPLYLSVVPERIASRLKPHKLNFDTLPGLLQRAVLWDAGLLLKGALSDNSDDAEGSTLVQTWTRCGSSMADIVIQPQEFAAAASACHLDSCTEETGSGSVVASRCCDFASVFGLSKCGVASKIVASESNGSIWSHESAFDMEARVPSFAIHRHTASGCDRTSDLHPDDTGERPSSLYSIRTARREKDGACSRALVIPCAPVELVKNSMPSQQWCYPKSESLLESWLSDYANRTVSGPVPPSKIITSSLVESSINAGVDISNAFAKLLDSSYDKHSIELAADHTRHYFRMYARGVSLPLELEGDVPAEILARLEPFQVAFRDLSGLLQRALLWDTGYALTPDIHGKLHVVEIHVKCGLRMANTALSAAYFKATGCAVDDCSVRNATSNATLDSFRGSKGCTVEQLEGATLCAAAGASVVVRKDESALWAVGDIGSAVPGMHVARRVTNASVMYSIDTSSTEVEIGQCPVRPSLTIPCISRPRDGVGPVRGEAVPGADQPDRTLRVGAARGRAGPVHRPQAAPDSRCCDRHELPVARQRRHGHHRAVRAPERRLRLVQREPVVRSGVERTTGRRHPLW
ncbi:hypothetical protein PybrP1_012578 [[Pythium] brassicae (nom. inval.)]|nr:hypothetical protein PybrP1_012578 [[Pythium] brassicae (nom. inval.)]